MDGVVGPDGPQAARRQRTTRSGRLRTRVFETGESLSVAAAVEVASIARRAAAERGTFHLMLSGGSSPRGLYATLAERDLGIPWHRTVCWFGDERMVPHDHPDSNVRMARETFLDRVPLDGNGIVEVDTSLPAVEAAAAYEGRMRSMFDRAVPRMDLVLLGLGKDGHTASLFPGTAAVQESVRLFVAGKAPGPPVERVSAALPLINAARTVAFLVRGVEKKQVVARVRALQTQAEREPALPATLVAPADGRLCWWLDREAASGF